jgi:hypothetical protein
MNLLRSPALIGALGAGALITVAAALAPATAQDNTQPSKPGSGFSCVPVEDDAPIERKQAKPQKIEVMFVVDTTGSMSGLIEGAKRKVWSIANEILSGEPRPRLSVGLVAYRDRGESYVTQVTQPTEDLDSVYQTLQSFQAKGGGDSPEHVNMALNDAFSGVQWSNDSRLKLVFLVGDAPAHRDYDRHLDYATIVPRARKNGILVNTVLCGNNSSARNQWQEISRLGGGEFFQIAQTGGMAKVSTPYDAKLRKIQRELEETRVSYGRAPAREKAAKAKARVLAMDGEAAAARASAVSKLGADAPSAAGPDLVRALRQGKLKGIAKNELPEDMRDMDEAELEEQVEGLAGRRAELERALKETARKRDAHVRAKAPKDGFDAKVLDSLKKQAEEADVATYR